MFTKESRRVPHVALTVAVVLALGAAMVASAVPASAHIVVKGGSALGYDAQVSLFGGVQPHDGPAPIVTLPAGGSATAVTATAASGLAQHGPATFFTSDRLDVSTQGKTGSTGSVTSSSNVINVNRSTTQPTVTGSEIFSADTVHSNCTAGSTISGAVSLKNAVLRTDNGLDLNNDGQYTDPGEHPPVNVAIAARPAANGAAVSGHIHINGSQDNFHVRFNEQIANPDGSITVNAVHEFFDGPTAIGYLIIGQSVCGVRATKTSVASSANPSRFGDPVTFTATVAPVAGSDVPTGTVQFKDNGANLGSPVALRGGKAFSPPISSLAVGSHTITAVYSGKGAFVRSRGTLTQTVH